MTEECAESKEINSIETPDIAIDPKETALVLIEYQKYVMLLIDSVINVFS